LAVGRPSDEARHKGLSTNTVVTELHMSVGFGDAGARHIAQALQQNTVLRTLILKGNDISDAGALPLITIVLERGFIRSLDLSRGLLGNSSCDALASALSENRGSLTMLNLSENRGISGPSMERLASALKTNTTLLQLEMEFCWNAATTLLQLGSEIAFLFAKACEVNRTLEYLSLAYNRRDDVAAGYFEMCGGTSRAHFDYDCPKGQYLGAFRTVNLDYYDHDTALVRLKIMQKLLPRHAQDVANNSVEEDNPQMEENNAVLSNNVVNNDLA